MSTTLLLDTAVTQPGGPMDTGDLEKGFGPLTQAIERPLSRSGVLRLLAGAISVSVLSSVWPGQSRADIFLHSERPDAPAQSRKSPKEVRLFDFLSPVQKQAARRGRIPDVTAELKQFFNAVGPNGGVFVIDPYEYAFEIGIEENNPVGSFSGVTNYTLKATGSVLHDKRDDYHVDADKDEAADKDRLCPLTPAYKHNPTFLDFRGCEDITIEGLSVTTQRGDLVNITDPTGATKTYSNANTWGLGILHFWHDGVRPCRKVRVSANVVGGRDAVRIGVEDSCDEPIGPADEDIKVTLYARECFRALRVQWSGVDIHADVFADHCIRPIFINGVNGLDLTLITYNQQSSSVIEARRTDTENVFLRYVNVGGNERKQFLQYEVWPPRTKATEPVPMLLLQWIEQGSGDRRTLKNITIELDTDNRGGDLAFRPAIALDIEPEGPGPVPCGSSHATLDGFEVYGIDKRDPSEHQHCCVSINGEAVKPFQYCTTFGSVGRRFQTACGDSQRNVYVHDLRIDVATVLPLCALVDDEVRVERIHGKLTVLKPPFCENDPMRCR
jgi:hypothetical protein